MSLTVSYPSPESGSQETEEAYEWVYDPVTKQRKKITRKNAMGRKCEKCGCNCPCSCSDCRPFCCSRGITVDVGGLLGRYGRRSR